MQSVSLVKHALHALQTVGNAYFVVMRCVIPRRPAPPAHRIVGHVGTEIAPRRVAKPPLKTYPDAMTNHAWTASVQWTLSAAISCSTPVVQPRPRGHVAPVVIAEIQWIPVETEFAHQVSSHASPVKWIADPVRLVVTVCVPRALNPAPTASLTAGHVPLETNAAPHQRTVQPAAMNPIVSSVSAWTTRFVAIRAGIPSALPVQPLEFVRGHAPAVTAEEAGPWGNVSDSVIH